MSSPEGTAPAPKVALADLVSHLDQYLEAARFEDYAPNGLQIEGRDRIKKIVTGVSACSELFDRADQIGADAVLVHHGLFWKSTPLTLTGIQYQRVARLMRSEISLIAYHLPLDAHPEIGNNALAARALGLGQLSRFGEANGNPIGFCGAFDQPVSAVDLATRCSEVFTQEPQLLGADSAARIRTVGLVSGAAQELLREAISTGLDAFITGEASEWVTNLSREAGLCYVAAGHYATEKLGIRALGDYLSRKFMLEVQFVDIPNPV